MRVNISPDIQSNNILLSLVAAANGVVESELGPAAGLVTVTWTVVADAGKPFLKMDVADSGRCEETFTLLDFYDFDKMKRRLHECGKRFQT